MPTASAWDTPPGSIRAPLMPEASFGPTPHQPGQPFVPVTHPGQQADFDLLADEEQDEWLATFYQIGFEPDFTDPRMLHAPHPYSLLPGVVPFCVCNWHPLRHCGWALQGHLDDMREVGNLVRGVAPGVGDYPPVL